MENREAEVGASLYIQSEKDIPVMIPIYSCQLPAFCPHFIAVTIFLWCDSFAMKISALGQVDLDFRAHVWHLHVNAMHVHLVGKISKSWTDLKKSMHVVNFVFQPTT